MKDTIGIVGQGFVGSAIHEGMKNFYDIETFDIDPTKLSTSDNISELVDKIDEIIFVCVPTPMKKNGRCDISIVQRVIKDINDASRRLNKKTISVVKSTVEPGTIDKLNKTHSRTTVIFNPEFLTEANSCDDFKNQSRIIIGGTRPATTKVKTMYRKAFPKTPIIKTGAAHAEMVKYFTNCFLATKVAFANEMYQICSELNLDYDKVIEYVLYDDRIGKTHLSCPGPDGRMGFGGHCFPKDLSAMIKFSKTLGVYPNIMMGVWEKNLEVRKPEDRDWEKMIGRAVSKS